MKKKNKKIKKISELSNKELRERAVIASDSVLMYEAIFDASDEGLIEVAEEYADEIKKRKKTTGRKI